MAVAVAADHLVTFCAGGKETMLSPSSCLIRASHKDFTAVGSYMAVNWPCHLVSSSLDLPYSSDVMKYRHGVECVSICPIQMICVLCTSVVGI